MIICKDGFLTIQGDGYIVSQEMGITLQYFVENCTETELETAFKKFNEELELEHQLKFYRALRKIM